MFDLCMDLFDSNCQVGACGKAVDLGLVRLEVWPGGLKADYSPKLTRN